MPFFAADILWSASLRKLHGHHHYELKHMILEHVAECPGLVIITGPFFHTDCLTGRNLHIGDIAVLP
ncbi:hypothetical protein D3C73_1477000 [compost metagenome]